jgi:hypothetical protein
MTQASLQRLIITFKPEELFLHALYGMQEGLSLNAKARRQRMFKNMGGAASRKLWRP